jgi:hypothetical protein
LFLLCDPEAALPDFAGTASAAAQVRERRTNLIALVLA